MSTDLVSVITKLTRGSSVSTRLPSRLGDVSRMPDRLTPLFSVLDSDGNTFTPPRTVLDSDGNEFAVPGQVLDSDGNTHNV